MSGCAEFTAEQLHKILNYNPDTGIFTWCRASSRAYIGHQAGCVKGNGYRLIGIGGRLFRAHRVAWLYMTGGWPSRQIDHIDLNRDNNRWANLREATVPQQRANVGILSTNTSGFKGVSWFARNNKWAAHIRIDGRSTNLGYFDTPEDAHHTYLVAAKKHFGEFANDGKRRTWLSGRCTLFRDRENPENGSLYAARIRIFRPVKIRKEGPPAGPKSVFTGVAKIKIMDRQKPGEWR